MLTAPIGTESQKSRENIGHLPADSDRMDSDSDYLALPFDAVKDLPYDDFLRWQTHQERSRKERKIINGLRVVA